MFDRRLFLSGAAVLGGGMLSGCDISFGEGNRQGQGPREIPHARRERPASAHIHAMAFEQGRLHP